MAYDIKKLAEIAKPRSESSIKEADVRKQNRQWLRLSQKIALSIRYYLRTEGLTQKALAEKMGMSPVYISKLMKGEENLTLETICKVQQAIGHDLISVLQPYVDSDEVKVDAVAEDAAPQYSVADSVAEA